MTLPALAVQQDEPGGRDVQASRNSVVISSSDGKTENSSGSLTYIVISRIHGHRDVDDEQQVDDAARARNDHHAGDAHHRDCQNDVAVL